MSYPLAQGVEWAFKIPIRAIALCCASARFARIHEPVWRPRLEDSSVNVRCSKRHIATTIFLAVFGSGGAEAQTPAPVVWPFECEVFEWLPGAEVTAVAFADSLVGTDTDYAADGGSSALASELGPVTVTPNQADIGNSPFPCIDSVPACHLTSAASSNRVSTFDSAPDFRVEFKYENLEASVENVASASCSGLPPAIPDFSHPQPTAFTIGEMSAPFEVAVEAWVQIEVSGSQSCGCAYLSADMNPCDCFSARVVSGGAGAGSCPAGTPGCVELCEPGTASVLLPAGQYEFASESLAVTTGPAGGLGCNGEGSWSCESDWTVELKVPARQPGMMKLWGTPLPECPKDAEPGYNAIGFITDDEGNRIEAACLATEAPAPMYDTQEDCEEGGLTWDSETGNCVVRVDGEFAVWYIAADGSEPEGIGNCVFAGGINRGFIYYTSDFNSNGIPDRFIKSAYSSRDPVDSDFDEFRILACFHKGEFIEMTFDYSVPTLLSEKAGVLGPDLIGPRPTIPDGSPPMVGVHAPDCDIDGDLDCDLDDETAFDLAVGTCPGDYGYYPLADLSGDGCVTAGERPPIDEVPTLSAEIILVLYFLIAGVGLFVVRRSRARVI